jgi:dCTP deaminase
LILSDICIQDAIRKKELIVEPFSADRLTSNGVDLTIGAFNDCSLRQDTFVLPPECHTLIGTKEHLELPNDLCAQVWIRSSLARKGLLASFGIVDCGYKGTLTLSMYNASDKDIVLRLDQPIVQVCFIRLTSKAEKPYSERSGNYQNSNGVVAAPLKKG